MKNSNHRRPVLLVVAERWDLERLKPVLGSAAAFIVKTLDIHPDPEGDEAAELAAGQVASEVLKLKPDVLVIGQTETAEKILFRCMAEHSCLVIRWSMFYESDPRIGPDHRPEDVGYHVDIPKTEGAIAALAGSRGLAEAVAKRDVEEIHRELPSGARALGSNLATWAGQPGVPVDDLPDSGIRNFVYLDEDGIRRLFDQTGQRHLEEVLVRRSKRAGAQASGKAGLGKLMTVLGIGSAELSLQAEGDAALSEEFKRKLSVPDKLRIVLAALAKGGNLRSVSDHPWSLSQIHAAVWVNYTGWFDTRPVLVAIDSREEFVRFESKSVPVVMGTSLLKYSLGLHHVRIQMGLTISRLRVIGELTPVGEGFYLKPFAFWQVLGYVP